MPDPSAHPERVCIIGAGSSGLAAARALAERGIAFDGFERGSDVGGIWRYRNDNFLDAELLDRIDPPAAGAPRREHGRIADNRMRLFRHVVPPDARDLFFLGLIQPLGAIPPLAEAQAEWVADLLAGEARLPPEREMREEIRTEQTRLDTRFVASGRRTLEVDFFPYLRAIRRERRRGRVHARHAPVAGAT